MQNSNSVSRREMLAAGLPAAALATMGLPLLGAVAPDGGGRGMRGAGAGGGGEANVVGRLMAQSFADGQYRLPQLPYGYEALEPHIDAQTMQLHHSRHHQAYVNGLNRTQQTLRELREKGDLDAARLEGLQRDLSFHGGGHVMHTVFWATMAPSAGGQPQGPIAEAINRDFGSFAAFQNYFTQVASGVKGSGWAVMCHEPLGNTLMVFALNEHDTKMIAGTTPLLPLDVWEHAYYLKYQNARGDYIKAWWNTVNWPAVNAAYQAAQFRGGARGGRGGRGGM